METVLHKTTLEYSTKLLKRAVRDYWRHMIGYLLPAATVLMLAFFVFLVWSGNRSWLVGLIGSVVVFAVAFMSTIYVAHLRSSIARLDAMGQPSATLELSDERLRIHSNAGASEVPFASITDVWLRKDYWLLFLGTNQFITIPTDNLSQDIIGFLRSKFEKVITRVA